MTTTDQMREVEHSIVALFSGEVAPKSTYNDLNDSVIVKFTYQNGISSSQLEQLLEMGDTTVKRSGNGLCVTLEYFV